MEKEKYEDRQGNVHELTLEEFTDFPYNSKLTKISGNRKPVQVKEEVNLNEMTKEELLDYSNEIGLSDKTHYRMSKSELKKIIEGE